MARSPARTICHPNLLSGSTKGNRPQLLAPAETVQNQTSTVGPTPLTLSEREAAALPVNQCRGPLKNEFLFAFQKHDQSDTSCDLTKRDNPVKIAVFRAEKG
jgi:hypothetical protein